MQDRSPALDRENIENGPRHVVIEQADDLSSLHSRVTKPLQGLRAIVRPDASTASSDLLQGLLPTLLDRVAAIDAIFWLVTSAEAIDAAESVIHDLSALVTVIPILLALDEHLAHKLTSTFHEVAGLTGEDQLKALKDGGMVVYANRSACGSLLLALRTSEALANTIDRTLVFIGQAPNSLNTEDHHRHQLPSSASGAASSTSGRSCSSGRSADIDSHGLPSLGSSLIGSLSIPTSSPTNSGDALETNETSPGAFASLRHSSPIPRSTAPRLDPLHLPSLIHLVGLNLVAGFRRWKSSFQGLFWSSRDVRTSTDVPPASTKEEAPFSSPAEHDSSCIGAAFILHPHRFYNPHNPAAGKVRGLVIAGVIVGLALFFS